MSVDVSNGRPCDQYDDFDRTNQAFRRTFLHECPAEMVPALSDIGYWLHSLVLAYGRPAGGFALAPRLDAALEDLKFLHSLLGYLEHERTTCQLEGDDLEVSRFAGRLMPQTAKLIDRIERFLASSEGRDEPTRSS